MKKIYLSLVICCFTFINVFAQCPSTSSISNLTNVYCKGGNTGEATVTASAGSGTYSYSWSDGQTTATATGLSAGTYSVTVIDSGCSDTTKNTVTISEPVEAFDAVITTSTDVFCGEANSGEASTAGTGGSGSYAYSWSDGQTTATATGLSVGTYTITVSDNNGCVTTVLKTVTIAETTQISVAVTSSTNCEGVPSSITASGATNYSWSDGSTSNTLTVTPTTTTTYTVTGTTGTCTGTAVGTVTLNPVPTVIVSDATVCAGSPATITANGADTYTWFGGGSQSGASLTLTPTASTSYTVTGTTGGCSSSTTTSVIVNPLPIIAPNASPSSAVVCSGNNVTLTASSTDTSITSFTWTGGIANGAPFTPTSTTTYVVTGITSSGCIGTATKVVTVFHEPNVLTRGNDNQTICINYPIQDIVYEVSTNYSITGLPAGVSASTQSNILTISGTPTIEGTYTYTLTPNNQICNLSSTPIGTITVKSLSTASNNIGNCDGFLKVSGTVFQDINNNCSLDASIDSTLNNIQVQLFTNIGELIATTYTHEGAYQFSVWKSPGVYIIKLDSSNAFSTQCSSGYTQAVSLSDSNPQVTDINFARKCSSVIDYGVRSTSTNGRVFPGEKHALNVRAGIVNSWYNFDCSEINSGTLELTITGPVTFNSVYPGALTPTINGNIFTYTIADWSTVDMYNDFRLYFDTKTTAQSWDQICVHAELTTTNTDANVSNNIKDFCYSVRNSYDPNMKEVYPINVLPNYNDWFNYTIHFQNTGDANAINIRLKDTLDSNLDLTTFEVLDYSHQNVISLHNNRLTVFYPNIELPDSTSNPEGSQGFVQYRLKPKANLPLGTKINNTASIYFDYNPPIVTNTTVNEYKTLETSITNNEGRNTFNVYPNPNSGVFTIQSEYSETYTVVNELGETVKEFTTTSGENRTVDLGNLSNGIYFILGVNNGELTHQKVVILK